MLEEFEDTEMVRRIHKSKKDRKSNGRKKKKRQKDKLQSTKHNTENNISIKMKPLRTGGEHIVGIL